MEDVTSVFATTVRELAAHVGKQPPKIRITPRATGTTARPGLRSAIFVPPVALQEPDHVQRWTAAHEFAHIHHRHRVREPWVTVPATLFVLFGVVAMVVAAVTGPTGFLIGLSAFCLGLLLIWYVTVRGRRRTEREADAQACAWGFHFTPAIQAFLEAAEAQQPTPSWLRRHDLPAVRHATCHIAHGSTSIPDQL